MVDGVKKIYTVNWSSFFVVQLSAQDFDDKYRVVGSLTKWCEENCQHQYMFTKEIGTEIKFCASPLANSPTGIKYKASAQSLGNSIIIAFESEEEATGFKLMFCGDNKSN